MSDGGVVEAEKKVGEGGAAGGGFWAAAGTRAVLGILLMAAGVLLSLHAGGRYAEKRYVVDAGACRMDVMSTERTDLVGKEHYSVVLFHGLAANKIIMEYLARGFAEMGIRVFTPDLPGHGRSPGPFTPGHAEECALSLVRGLTARGFIYPDKTILAGHSMGGAMALLVAEKYRPAGVIAISPAPMVPAHGATPVNLLFHGAPKLGPNTLIMAGQFEPAWMTKNAEELAEGANDPTVKYERVDWNTHVGVIFSRTVTRRAQAWAAKVFGLPDERLFPSRAHVVGGLMGLIGIVILAGPFLRESLGKKELEEARPADLPSAMRIVVECFIASALAVGILHFVVPLRFEHLFEGDYLASFFLIVGALLLAAHPQLAVEQFPVKGAALMGALFGGFVLHFLLTGWFELTTTGAWLTLQRWERFPVFLVAVAVFWYALECLLGPAALSRYRVLLAMVLVVVCWIPLMAGVFYFGSGELLMVLLVPYFLLCFLFTLMGTQLVRRLTASATAAAVFGAILLAGFCLALFPVG
jgi:pimeloyl-ACP methyl ester carboxylesterase